jgi:hypothetical protein
MSASASNDVRNGIVALLRAFVRRLLPQRFLKARGRAAEKRLHRKYENLPVDRVFAEIYGNKDWGAGEGAYYSGSGSHDVAIVAPYVDAVRILLSRLPEKPVVVDLGSGDFNVGGKFVDLARHYFACDIVAELQEHNRRHFPFPNVEFLRLNAIDDNLPDGDVIFIRQVLQHLPNKDIRKILDKCCKYDRWVVTEHLPSGADFVPNVDIAAGCGFRPLFNSGVVLTAPPFSVAGYSSRVLCEVSEYGGVIRTILFERNARAKAEAGH